MQLKSKETRAEKNFKSTDDKVDKNIVERWSQRRNRYQNMKKQ
jgi:hypothetical protein